MTYKSIRYENLSITPGQKLQKMSTKKSSKYQCFFWGGGEEGSAYYSQNIAAIAWPSLDPVKYILSSAIGKFDISKTLYM